MNPTEGRIRTKYSILQSTYVARLRQIASAMNNEAAVIEKVNCRPCDHWSSAIPELTRLLNSLNTLNEFYVQDADHQ